MTEIKNKILHTLKKENLRMIPRWQFVLYSTLVITGAVFAFLLATFTCSLVIFVLSRYGFLSMPFFEFVSILRTLNVVPIILIVVTLVLLGIIEVLSRNYAFSFRKPLGVTLLSLTTIALGISFVIGLTPAHEYVLDYAKNHHMNFMMRAYERPLPLPSKNKRAPLRGVVLNTSSSTFTIRLFDGNELTIPVISSIVIMPSVGDDVVVLGKFIDGAFVPQEFHYAKDDSFKKRKENRKMLPKTEIKSQDRL